MLYGKIGLALLCILSLFCFRLELEAAQDTFTVEEALSKNSQESLLDKEIQLRGFVYTYNDMYILASQPNLKSCCLGKFPQNQIWIKELTGADTDRAVKLQGVLVRDKEDRLMLINAAIIKETRSTTGWFLPLGGVLLFLIQLIRSTGF